MAASLPTEVLRPHAEDLYAEELAALKAADQGRPKPPNWQLSPWAVVTYLLGGQLDNGFEIEPKYIGQRRLMEIAVATLATPTCSCKAPLAPPKTACATPGTTPACWPKGLQWGR
jgi:hypothetical protein